MAENMPPADFMTATRWSVNDVKNRHTNGDPQERVLNWSGPYFT